MTLQREIAAFCHRHRLRPDTNKGQHFLISETVLDRILEAARPQPGDCVVEVGPGIGILTKALLEADCRVTAIEIDASLIPLLEHYVGPAAKPGMLTIIEGNALHVPFPEDPYRVIANIPYHISSPLLRHMFLEGRAPLDATLLIQREVAEKICAKEESNLLSLLVSFFGESRMVCRVPPSAFLPPPDVDSAVLHIRCFPTPRAPRETIDRAMTLAKQAFSQRRKMLRNTIGSLPEGMEMLAQAKIDPMRRPQTLSPEEWATLANIAP